MRTRIAALLLFAVALPTAGAGQTATLDSIQAMLQDGRYAEARTAIADWWERTDRPTTDQVVRGHLLRARLTLDPAEADADYLAVVLGHPTNAGAAEALLRLGQSFLLRGDIPRAEGYLQRLVADYPGTPFHGPGSLWLARAYNRADQHQAACSVARDALAGNPDPDLAALLRLEEAGSCRLTADRPETDSAQRPARPARQPAAQPARQPAENRPAAETPAGNFAVQAGAFRQRQGAEDLAAKLRDAGHQPRLVMVAGSSLLRVRIGRFPDAQAAGEIVRQLKDQGFDAIVVGDADRERRP